jgi:DNA-binding NarL/FixJ family response regulator
MEFAQLREPVTLVIEDHAALRHALCEWVAMSFGRCRVREACSVEDALLIIDSETIDIVLMDVQLPGMDGIDGTRCVLKRSPRTAVVMVSNHDDSSHRAAAAAAGVTAFVPKRAIRKELPPVLRRLMVQAVFEKNPEITTWVNG